MSLIVTREQLKVYQSIPLMSALVHISRHVKGFTIEQTAKKLNITIDSVRVQEAKAKRLLKFVQIERITAAANIGKVVISGQPGI